MAYIYILKCRDNTYYAGITINIKRRIKEHNRGENKYTSNRRPLNIKYIQLSENIKTARVIELKIKRQGVKRWWMKNKDNGLNIDILVLSFNSQQPFA